MRAWVLTDGTPGVENPCLGVAEAAADRIERRRVSPRAPWSWGAFLGRIDPREAPEAGAGPLAPKPGEPWPDLVVAAGRRAAPCLTRVKTASGGRCVTVFIGPAGARAGVADLVWAPERMGLIGANVIASPTRPHRIGPVRLAAARGGSRLVGGTGPLVGILLGGGSRFWKLPEEDVAALVAGLKRLKDDGAILFATPSRRTPERLALAIREVAHHFWDGAGQNPYVPLLAQSDVLVVTADSTDMLGEAVATGKPVMAFRSQAFSRSGRALADRLTALGCVRPFGDKIERFSYAPLDSTREIARAIHALSATRAVLARGRDRRARVRAPETNGPSR